MKKDVEKHKKLMVLFLIFSFLLSPFIYQTQILIAHAEDTKSEENALKIINPHEHPKAGDMWVVKFQTKAKDTLSIIPKDQQTIDDLEFRGLYCGDEKIDPVVVTNDVLVVKDWECNQTARVEHKVLKAGDHTLNFQFKDAKENAYNSALWQWAKRLGGTGVDSVASVAIDSQDNIIYTGYSVGNADVNGDGDSTDGGAESASGYGNVDIIISVFNSSGTWQWAKRLGGTAHDFGRSVAIDSHDNIIVLGEVNGSADVNGDGDSTDGGAESTRGHAYVDGIISVFNSSGTWQWAKRLGAGNPSAFTSITVDKNDNIIYTGYVYQNEDVNGDGDSIDGGAESSSGYGSYDIIVSVFNSSGTWQWAKRLGGVNLDTVFSVTTDSNNNIVLGGNVTGNADVNGDRDSNDGGAESASGFGSNDIVLSVFNSSGTWQWAKRFGTVNYDVGLSVKADSSNNIIWTGNVVGDADVNGDRDFIDGGAESATGYGNADIVVSVLDSLGAWRWAKRLGGTGSDATAQVNVDSNNNVLLAGTVVGVADSNSDGDFTDGIVESASGYAGNDILISTFDSSGTWQWAKRFGGTDNDYAYSVVADSDDNVIIAGQISGNADVNGDDDSTDGGAESATGYGNSDILITKFLQDTEAPVISLSSVHTKTSDSTPVIGGTASDSLWTISTVEYQIDSTSGSWASCTADDGAFDEAEEEFTCAPSSDLTDGSHTIYIRASDLGSNYTQQAYLSEDSFIVDTTAPKEGKIKFYVLSDIKVTSKDGEDEISVTSNRGLKVKFSATDESTDIEKIMVSEHHDFRGAKWREYTGDKIKFKLSNGDEEKTVYVKFKDSVGNVSRTYSKKVFLDTTGPNLKLHSINGIDFNQELHKTFYIQGNYIGLSGTSDDGSQITVAVDGIRQEQTVETNNDGNWDLQYFFMPDGSHKVEVKSHDSIGNFTLLEFTLVADASGQLIPESLRE